MRAIATLKFSDIRVTRRQVQLVGLALVASTSVCAAQDTTRAGPLFDALARMDKELFDAAFVNCDADKFQALFTDDAEFYHDRTGLASGEEARTMKSCPRDNGVTRTLMQASLEVDSMQGYGAVQIGRHFFAKKGEPGSEIAKFAHLPLGPISSFVRLEERPLDQRCSLTTTLAVDKTLFGQ